MWSNNAFFSFDGGRFQRSAFTKAVHFWCSGVFGEEDAFEDFLSSLIMAYFKRK